MKTKSALARIENKKNFKAGEVISPDSLDESVQSASEFFQALSRINWYLRNKDLTLTQENKAVAEWKIINWE